MKWRPASEKPDKLLETYYCKVYRDEIKQGWKKTVLITLDGVWNTDDTVIEWLDESPSGANVLHEALKRLVDLKDLKDREGKPGYYETHQPAAWEQARKALAQYNAVEPEDNSMFRGEVIGTIAYNPKSGDLRVTPYPEEFQSPQTPIDREPEAEDQETLWDQFFDQIVWDERESNSEVNQIMKSLQRKYRITRK